jgi:hypothetical protein
MMPAWSVENVRQGDPCGAGLGAGIALNFITTSCVIVRAARSCSISRLERR